MGLWDDIKNDALEALCREMQRGAGRVRATVDDMLVDIIVEKSNLPPVAVQAIIGNLSERARREMADLLDGVWHRCAEPGIIDDCVADACAAVRPLVAAGAAVDPDVATNAFLVAYQRRSGVRIQPGGLSLALQDGVSRARECVPAQGGERSDAASKGAGTAIGWGLALLVAAKVFL